MLIFLWTKDQVPFITDNQNKLLNTEYNSQQMTDFLPTKTIRLHITVIN